MDPQVDPLNMENEGPVHEGFEDLDIPMKHVDEKPKVIKHAVVQEEPDYDHTPPPEVQELLRKQKFVAGPVANSDDRDFVKGLDVERELEDRVQELEFQFAKMLSRLYLRGI